MERRSLMPSLFGWPETRAATGDVFTSLQREVNRMFDDVFRSTGMPAGLGATNGMMSPSIDVRELDSTVEVHAELPGVKTDDIDVALDDDLLTIKGEKRYERTQDEENVHVMERSYGAFTRTIRLPFAPDPDSIKADFMDGVLTVSVPKPPERQMRHRRIQIAKDKTASPTGKLPEARMSTEARTPAEAAKG